MKSVLAGAMVLIGIAGVFVACQGEQISQITPAEAQKMILNDQSLVLLDVRTPEEFHGDTGHLAGAILIPVQELEKRMDELTPFQGRSILVYCRTGHRSTVAMEILQQHKFKVLNIVGGIARWSNEKFPVVKEPH